MRVLVMLLAFLASAIGSVSATELAVSLQEVTDTRTSGGMFKGLKVKLKVGGPALSDAWGIMPPTLAKAESDLGENLLDTADHHQTFAFLKLRPLDANKECTLELDLKNPGRQARSVTLSGTMTAYVPHGHKAETVVVTNYRQYTGTILVHPELQRRGIQIKFTVNVADQQNVPPRAETPASGGTTSTPTAATHNAITGLVAGMLSSGNPRHGLSMEIIDTEDQVLWVQLFDGANKPIAFNGWSCRSGTPIGVPVLPDHAGTNQEAAGAPKQCTFETPVVMPKEGQLVLYLSTDENLRTLPFSIGIDLP